MLQKNIIKILVASGIILALLIGILTFTLLNKKPITGETVSEYMHTRAVCDENNFCRDYEITCDGKKLVRINPTGFAVQNSKDWQDPRNPDDTEQWCNISE